MHSLTAALQCAPRKGFLLRPSKSLLSPLSHLSSSSSTSGSGGGGSGPGNRVVERHRPPPSSPLKRRSKLLTGDPDTATVGPSAPGSYAKATCSRANLRAVGWKDADFAKPVITVAVPWSNALPCNAHLRSLADQVVEAITEERGGKAFVCGTPVISDGMTNGTPGMRYSLVSREVIADAIETFHEGYMADALFTLGGCDKSTPAALMPIPRCDAVGVTLYGGTALPGKCGGCVNGAGGAGLDAGTVMEAIGEYGTGRMPLATLDKLERCALPGVGTCSAMFTANTMSAAIEALGMAVPGSASRPALHCASRAVAASVDALWRCMERGLTARDIMTFEAFENAAAVVYALGGSSNAVLHLLALARECDLHRRDGARDDLAAHHLSSKAKKGVFDLEALAAVGAKVPLLGHLSPHGPHHMSDLHALGALGENGARAGGGMTTRVVRGDDDAALMK